MSAQGAERTACAGPTCASCADAAVAMRVAELAPPLAPARCVALDGTEQLVLLDLVDAVVGAEVLVHAGVAIALVDGGGAP